MLEGIAVGKEEKIRFILDLLPWGSPLRHLEIMDLMLWRQVSAKAKR